MNVRWQRHHKRDSKIIPEVNNRCKESQHKLNSHHQYILYCRYISPLEITQMLMAEGVGRAIARGRLPAELRAAAFRLLPTQKHFITHLRLSSHFHTPAVQLQHSALIAPKLQHPTLDSPAASATAVWRHSSQASNITICQQDLLKVHFTCVTKCEKPYSGILPEKFILLHCCLSKQESFDGIWLYWREHQCRHPPATYCRWLISPSERQIIQGWWVLRHQSGVLQILGAWPHLWVLSLH